MLSFRGRSKRLECYRVAMKHHEIHTCLLPQSVGSLRQFLAEFVCNSRMSNIDTCEREFAPEQHPRHRLGQHNGRRSFCCVLASQLHPSVYRALNHNANRPTVSISAFINSLCAVHSACAVVRQRHVCPLHTSTSNVQLSQRVPHALPVMSC